VDLSQNKERGEKGKKGRKKGRKLEIGEEEKKKIDCTIINLNLAALPLRI